MTWLVYFMIVVTVMCVACCANGFLVWWPSIAVTYSDISTVYPTVIWIGYILVVLVLTCLCLYWYAVMDLRAERQTSLKSLESIERDKIRQDISRVMKAEAAEMKQLVAARMEALAVRESEVLREIQCIQSAEFKVEGQKLEYNIALSAVALKEENLTYWLTQVDAGVEVLGEQCEALCKMHAYLSMWIDKVTASPTEFIAEISKKKFDKKRFGRNVSKLAHIQIRCQEIKDDCLQTKAHLEVLHVEDSNKEQS